jgi:hypothetical protein
MLLSLIVALWSAAVAQPGVTPEHRPTPPDSDEQRIADLVVASRILVQEGVLDSFGHVTVRSLNNPNHYFMPRAMPPALVTAKDIVELNLDSVPIDANAPRTNGERFIHGEIYRVRPDVGAIVHSHSPAVIPFRRAMPWQQPKTLTDDEVYALTAYILALNKIIGENDVINAETLPKVKMPNRDGFISKYPDKH